MIDRELGPARVWFTDRLGGTSTGVYAGNNLADHVGDDPSRVGENRRRLGRELAAVAPSVPADPAAWGWLRQVHRARVVTATAPVSSARSPVEADASVTGTRGQPLAILAADCAPIALASDTAIAVVHAGWPGLEQGVIGAAVRALRDAGTGPVRALLGPCIHAARYAFGADLLARLVTRLGPEVAARTDLGEPSLDVPAAVRRALALAGVDAVDDVDVCTAASPEHFSYRRDGVTGRQALVAVLQ